jgi:integrase
LYKIALTDIAQLTPELMNQYLAERPPSRPSTYNNHVGNLRRSFTWMISQETLSTSPLQRFTPRTEENLKPYILSHDVVKRLLEMAGQLRDTSNGRRRGRTYQLVFALAYVLGLRVGEISRLQIGDIDFQRAVLVINRSKFSNSRGTDGSDICATPKNICRGVRAA